MKTLKLSSLFLFAALMAILWMPVSCENQETDPFSITTGRVGKLKKDHRLAQLESVYAADSLVRDTLGFQFGNTGKVEVFEKGGAHLLTLTPGTDSLQSIQTVRIRDARFQTEKGIGLESSFGDVQKAYEIRKILSSLNNILVLPKNSDVYFTISREALPGSLRYSDAPVEAVQIPETAPIKYMMVDWE